MAADPESSGIGDLAGKIISAALGALAMLFAGIKAWGTVQRDAKEAKEEGKANAHAIAELQLYRAGAESDMRYIKSGIAELKEGYDDLRQVAQQILGRLPREDHRRS